MCVDPSMTFLSHRLMIMTDQTCRKCLKLQKQGCQNFWLHSEKIWPLWSLFNYSLYPSFFSCSFPATVLKLTEVDQYINRLLDPSDPGFGSKMYFCLPILCKVLKFIVQFCYYLGQCVINVSNYAATGCSVGVIRRTSKKFLLPNVYFLKTFSFVYVSRLSTGNSLCECWYILSLKNKIALFSIHRSRKQK